VIDYRAVDPAFGEWADIARLGERFRLMFDAVINHASAHSDWFQAFLRDDPIYKDYFISIEGEPRLAQSFGREHCHCLPGSTPHPVRKQCGPPSVSIRLT
jgi:sucrose phosphorylase